jgi:hypothetical protein
MASSFVTVAQLRIVADPLAEAQGMSPPRAGPPWRPGYGHRR